MIVSLNTVQGMNSSYSKAQGQSRQGSARLSAPISDSVSFEGSEAKSPLKSFFKKVGMVGAFATAALGFTSCDPTDGPDVPDVKPPVVKVDPDANLSPLQKSFKHTMAPVLAMDTAEVGMVQQVKVFDEYWGESYEYILDEAKSSKDTLAYKLIIRRDDGHVEGTHPTKFFVDKEGVFTQQFYETLDGNTTVFKYRKDVNSIVERMVDTDVAYKYIPDKIGQSIKYQTGAPDYPAFVKLISKTMKKL